MLTTEHTERHRRQDAPGKPSWKCPGRDTMRGKKELPGQANPHVLTNRLTLSNSSLRSTITGSPARPLHLLYPNSTEWIGAKWKIMKDGSPRIHPAPEPMRLDAGQAPINANTVGRKNAQEAQPGGLPAEGGATLHRRRKPERQRRFDHGARSGM